MNNGNLRTLSPSEARENGRKGGVASGVSRRERKELRERLELALELPCADDETQTNAEAICRALIAKALDGDVRAFTVIRDTIGEMPVQRAVVASEKIAPEVYEEVERLLMGCPEELEAAS